MSNEKKETIEDILSEMRDEASEKSADASCAMECATLCQYSDRIEAAYKRLALPTIEQWKQIAQQNGEISELKRENARLIAAAPELYQSLRECLSALNSVGGMGWDSSQAAMIKRNAVKALEKAGGAK